jgi:hypothetical protein
MLIGEVYRLRVTNLPLAAGLEVFPTIEVVDRLYPPVGQEGRFPVPIELTQEELELALDGKFVTRVIYLEDPAAALPVAEDPVQQTYFEAASGDNPLEVADRLGRPMAILRLGGRLPEAEGPDATFLFGSPPWVRFTPAAVERIAVPPAERRVPVVEPPADEPGVNDSAASGSANWLSATDDIDSTAIAPLRQPLILSGSTMKPHQVAR